MRLDPMNDQGHRGTFSPGSRQGLTTLPFEKWEGLGNDFILVRDPAAAIDVALVRRLCDRRLGVGADGVLVLLTKGAEPVMVVHNADGSRPEMCGNGLRCVAAHLLGDREAATLSVTTDAGPRRCLVRSRGGADFEVTVDMGQTRRGDDLTAETPKGDWSFVTIDVGNPHAVSFAPFDASSPGDLDVVGPMVEALPKGGTNVELCRLGQGRIDVLVWERGVGRTQACGTGACAVAAAACDLELIPFDVPILVGLPGGDLEITIDRATRHAVMRGPARRVFEGEVAAS